VPNERVVEEIEFQTSDPALVVTVAKSIALFAPAALFEIGGAWLDMGGPGRRRARRLRLCCHPAAFDGFHPERWDITGAAICLLGVAVLMNAPRA
jgi:small multidrug resistance family-3 protein